MAALDFYQMYLADSKVYLLNHLKSLQAAAALHQAKVNLSVSDFYVTVDFPNQKLHLYPQFLEILGVGPLYTETFSSDAICFTGWRPYQAKSIASFADKLAFKQRLRDHDFLVPPYSVSSHCRLDDVIVKCRHSSFGKGMHGPFKNADEYGLNPEEGEYFERFIKGTIVKIAYWDATPIAMEAQAMPVLTGDGQRTLLAIAQSQAKERGRHGLDELALDEMLAYQGYSNDAVLAKGESVLADFRYESDCLARYAVKEMPWPHPMFASHEEALLRLGEVLFNLIREDKVDHLYYSVDAIVSEDDRLYLLEVNANPTVHQSAYLAMLRSLACKDRSA